jgi:MYXO-CTERM domain-containing protein
MKFESLRRLGVRGLLALSLLALGSAPVVLAQEASGSMSDRHDRDGDEGKLGWLGLLGLVGLLGLRRRDRAHDQRDEPARARV